MLSNKSVNQMKMLNEGRPASKVDAVQPFQWLSQYLSKSAAVSSKA
jgi:hypothetical protein